jgi:hypothetical protein
MEVIPAEKEPGVLYVSLEFGVASHLCPCGCGSVVVTALAPHRWSLIFDGETVSLTPSIGNWSQACQSHYWIRNNKIRWVGGLSAWQIKGVQLRDIRGHESRAQKKAHRKRRPGKEKL